MRRLLNAVLFVLGVLALYAVSVQLRTSVLRGLSLANFLSLFTTQSNLFAAFVLIFLPNNAGARGAATLYMTITGVIYALFLSHGDPALWEWNNLVFHYVMPAALLAIWLIDPPVLRSNYVAIIAAWLAYPCAYACYTLVRGSLAHWYPYGFLDPRAIGWGGVAAVIAIIAVFAAFVALALAWYAKHRRTAPQLT